MHLSYSNSFFFSIDLVSYACLILLIAIFFLALRINAKISNLTNNSHQATRPTPKSNHAEETDPNIEVEPGSHFEEFLNEDPSRRALTKKEQFAAYRDWRSQKGLNWK